MGVNPGGNAKGARLGNRFAQQVGQRVVDARVADASRSEKKLHDACRRLEPGRTLVRAPLTFATAVCRVHPLSKPTCPASLSKMLHDAIFRAWQMMLDGQLRRSPPNDQIGFLSSRPQLRSRTGSSRTVGSSLARG